MAFLRRFATAVTVLHEGKVLSEGSVEEVQADPKVREVYLGRSATSARARPGSGAGGRIEEAWREPRGRRDLEVCYGRTQVLFGVSLEVPDGALVCLMGRNGAGKTTLLNAIMGMLPAKAGLGAARRPGHHRLAPVAPGAGRHRLRAPGPPGVPAADTPGEPAGRAGAQPVAGPSAIDDALDVFPALTKLLDRPAGLLSGGQAQQLAIARALVDPARSCSSSTSPPRASSRRSSSRSRTPSPSCTARRAWPSSRRAVRRVRPAPGRAVRRHGGRAASPTAGTTDEADPALFADLLTV